MKYNITIKDNDTGKVIKSMDVNAIIAGLSVNDGSVSFALTACNGEDLFNTIISTKKSIDEVVSTAPQLSALLALYEMDKIVEKIKNIKE
ncbi:MAG: hypothetical protein ACI4MS_03285 [Candidatus Coproplasma sp.]